MHDHPSPEEVAALETAYRSAPDSRAFAPLADAYRELGRLDEAVAILQRGTEQHPTYVSALVLQAECELQRGEVEQAEATFARVAELEPDNLVALKYRATRAANRGAAEHAATLWQQVLDLDPFDVAAREARDRLQQTPAPPVPESDAAAFDALGAVPDVPEPAIAEPAPQDTSEPLPEITLPEVPQEPAPEEGIEPSAAPTIEPEVVASHDAAVPTAESDVAETLHGFEPLEDEALETLDPDAGTPAWSGEAPAGTGEVLPDEPLGVEDASDAHAPPTPAFDVDAPAKPLADWHVQRADDRIVVRQGPDPGPGESDLGPPQRLTDEFSTLTLARIYESQGYLDKALDIYQTLHAKHPEHPEVLDRLRALQERMAGFEEGADAEVPDAADDPRPSFEFAPAEAANVEPVPEDADDPEALQLADADDEIAAAAMAHDPTEPAAPHEHDTAVPSPPIAEEPHADLGATPPVSDEDVPYEDGVAWRLLDVESLDAEPHRRAEELREVTEGVRAREQAKRHTVIGTPQQTPRPRQAKEQSASSEPDFERFLRYVRSIKR